VCVCVCVWCIWLGSNRRDDWRGKEDDQNQYANAFCLDQRRFRRAVCNIFLRHTNDLVITDIGRTIVAKNTRIL